MTSNSPRKDPGFATILSFFWCGLGQIYNGQIGKGVCLLVIQGINFGLIFVGIGLITYPIFWVFGMVDAKRTAERLNDEAAPDQIADGGSLEPGGPAGPSE